MFHSYGDVTITDEGLQILTFLTALMQMSSEGSWACHTNWDTGRPFISEYEVAKEHSTSS